MGLDAGLTRRGVLAGAGAGAGLLATPGARAAGPLKKITYAVATADLNVGYPFATLPKALGYFEAEGLDVDIVPGQSSAGVAQVLLSGRAQVGIAQPDPIVTQRANSRIPLLSFYCVARRGTNRFVVLPDAPIQSVRDFKGRKIGVNDLGAGGVVYLRAQLKQAGMTPNDVQMISVGYGTPSFEALKNGVVDAEIGFTGGIVRQQMAGYAVRMLPTTEAEQNQYSYNLFASDSFIAANPDVIAGIGRATAKAEVFIKTNPEAAVRSYWKQYPDRAPKDPNDKKAFETDLAIVNAQVRDMALDAHPVDFQWGSQDASVFAYIQSYLSDAGQIPTPIPPEQFFTNKFVAQFNDFDRASIIKAAQDWT